MAEVLAFARVWQNMADTTLQAHGEMTRRWCERLLQSVNLGEGERRAVLSAAEFHDIGKVFMPAAILNKTGPLGYVETESMRLHPEVGARLFAFPGMELMAQCIRSHHEWYDGRGYPDHLVGEELHLGARVLSVADSIAAMLEARPYQAPASRERIAEELQKGAGTQFDPVVAGVALSLLKQGP